MFIIGNFLYALAYIADIALGLYMWAIIISALLSWVNPDPYNPIVIFLRKITNPVLYPLRKHMGAMGGLDLSPMIVILVIIFIRRFLIVSLFDIAMRLKG